MSMGDRSRKRELGDQMEDNGRPGRRSTRRRDT
jgi:hypothetical protein